MKSYAVDSVYAFIIFVVAFLILPFFVPYEGEGKVSAPLGEYSIEEEEKPEVFTRVIDRVSSFYRLKRKKRPYVKAGAAKEAENAKTASLKRQNSTKNEAQTKNGVKIVSAPERFSEAENLRASSSNGYARPSAPDMAELNGNLYKIMPDHYGNKYVITGGGPVPLKSFLANGGRVVKPVYSSGNERGAAGAGKVYTASAYPGNTRARSSGQNIPRTETVNKNSSGHGSLTGFSHGRASLPSSESGSSNYASFGSGRDKFSIGPYDFNSDNSGFEELKGNLNSSSGGSPGQRTENAESRIPKAYKLQNIQPILSDKSISVTDAKTEQDISLSTEGTDASFDEWGDASADNWDENPAPEPSKDKQTAPQNVIVRKIEKGDVSSGFIPSDELTRRAMTDELLGGLSFQGVAGRKNIPVKDPWILPNSIDDRPGNAFIRANSNIISEKDEKTRGLWTESDMQYAENKDIIAASTKGESTALVMINGQKDPYTMLTMPENSYYYQVTAGLLNNNVRKVENNGSVDLNKIDRNKVLVVVPEKPLAENLRKDGYKVALFERYIVTPRNLNNFYKQTSSAVNEIETAKQAELDNKKKDIAFSLKN
ncbi:hypothetical protein [Candidatus Proelusimicrobium excrementi]|uniref:hypothetical protein n=1 Tax=Candidatus Proelusimicrobium excrementi TaxID=3416222 RepID=UPI003CBE9817|nr:hypothetical protein [Elusimicrobiaceae bacterium]